MYSPNGFKDRVAEARAAARFGTVLTRDKEGRAKVVLVPGHNMATYRVIIRRHKDESTGRSFVTTECHKDAGPAGYVPCNGSLAGVCYHGMAAIVVAIEDAGHKAMLSDDYEVGKKLKNFGINTFALRSHQSGAELYVTVK